MTRINCIPVYELNKKMLFSEYRELPRIFSWLEGVLEKQKEPLIPDHYVLGKGHMSFFADKLNYLNDRQVDLIDECLKRNIKLKLTGSLKIKYRKIPKKYWNDWTLTAEAQELNRQRIKERLDDSQHKRLHKSKTN